MTPTRMRRQRARPTSPSSWVAPCPFGCRVVGVQSTCSCSCSCGRRRGRVRVPRGQSRDVGQSPYPPSARHRDAGSDRHGCPMLACRHESRHGFPCSRRGRCWAGFHRASRPCVAPNRSGTAPRAVRRVSHHASRHACPGTRRRAGAVRRVSRYESHRGGCRGSLGIRRCAEGAHRVSHHGCPGTRHRAGAVRHASPGLRGRAFATRVILAGSPTGPGLRGRALATRVVAFALVSGTPLGTLATRVVAFALVSGTPLGTLVPVRALRVLASCWAPGV